MTNPTESNYTILLEKIISLNEKSKQDSLSVLNKILLKRNWEIGRLILEEEQKGNVKAKYGDHLLERLSEDLTEKAGKGFSISSLALMRKFYLEFPIFQDLGKLTWNHYIQLLSIEDESKRKQWLNLAIENQWTSPQLLSALKNEKLVLGQDVDENNKNLGVRIIPKRGILGTFGLKMLEDTVTGEKELCFDLGFHDYEPLSEFTLQGVAQKDLTEKDIVDLSFENGQYVLTKSHHTRRDIYSNVATVLKFIDGDTLTAKIKTGFRGYLRRNIRFAKINCPEIDTPKGKEALAFVVERLRQVSFFVMKTSGYDARGRYLADVFYLPRETNPQKVMDEGIYLNAELVKAGLAEIWHGEEE